MYYFHKTKIFNLPQYSITAVFAWSLSTISISILTGCCLISKQSKAKQYPVIFILSEFPRSIKSANMEMGRSEAKPKQIEKQKTKGKKWFRIINFCVSLSTEKCNKFKKINEYFFLFAFSDFRSFSFYFFCMLLCFPVSLVFLYPFDIISFNCVKW